MKIDTTTFKKIIILFWTLWWLIALWTDITGALAHLGWLTAPWAPDMNYPFLVSSLAMYSVPNWLTACLFSAIIAWSACSTLAFIWASLGLSQIKAVWLRRADVAFIISLSFWMAFFLADQMVMKFDLEQNHMVQGGLQLMTYLALYLLPDN